MRAYDLCFEDDDGFTWSPGRRPEGGPGSVPAGPADGWIGSRGPAIGDAAWPRGPVTGLPMLHALTLRLPADWHVRGPELVAISLFQGEGQFADVDNVARGDEASDDPFLRQLAAHAPHETEQQFVDVIGGRFAMVWLTDAEFSAGSAAPPDDVRRPGEHGNLDEGPNAWDDESPTRRVRLIERDDRNAGIAPIERGDDGGYEPPFDAEARDWKPWAKPLATRMHLGGTMFPSQWVPDGFGPAYLELWELPGMNIGGDGALQVDLESGAFDWQCG